jgi:poly(3-hydroxybutyrate) depolymerase
MRAPGRTSCCLHLLAIGLLVAACSHPSKDLADKLATLKEFTDDDQMARDAEGAAVNVFALLLRALVCPQGAGEKAQALPELPREPAAALAALLDLPSPADRRAAADRLAARGDVPLEQWLAAARAVPLRRDAPQDLDERTQLHRAPLWICGAQLITEIVVRRPRAPASQAGPMPLLFVGHEAGSDARHAVETWTPLADRFGWLLAAHTEPYEPFRTTGWAYEPQAQEAAYEALRAVRRLYDVDEQRIVIAGVGRGGHMAWDIALRQPDLFTGLIAIDGSPRLGNALYDDNLRFIEALPPMAVREVECSAKEPLQAANRRRALQLLRSFGAGDARLLQAADVAAAFAAPDAAWDSLFAARRTVSATLVRVPELGMTPPPQQFGRRHWFDIVRVSPKAPLTRQLPPSVPARLDDQGRRELLDDFERGRAPRLRVTRTVPGTFTAASRDVDAFRLLLTPATAGGSGTVAVLWDGHPLRKPTAPSATVLLREFAERFDRTFLPTIEVLLP